jgi:AraC-like DNA-binding protein
MSGAHDQPSASLDQASVDAAPSAPAAHPAGQPAQPGGDPLSDVLRTVRLKGALFFLVDATDPWCVDVPRAEDFAGIILPAARHVVSYHIVLEGRGLASVPGEAPVPIEAGDIVVFPHADPYAMCSAPGVPPEFGPEETIGFFRELAAGRLPFVVSEGGGGEPRAKFICGFLGCDLAPFNPLLEALPRLLLIRRPDGPDLLDRLVELAMVEVRTARAGGESIRLGLSELMFVELLRRHLAAQPPDGPGWLAGLGDPVVGRALARLHGQPARDWTLDELARTVGASRTVLAERFAARVGQTPMRYLTLWRMQIAARMLADGGEKVAAIGEAVGFRSEAAFSRAFRRTTGQSPAGWRRGTIGASG